MWMLIIITFATRVTDPTPPIQVLAKDYRQARFCEEAARALNDALPSTKSAVCVRQP